MDVFNNLDYSLNKYNVTGVIESKIDSGVFYYTGPSSGYVPLYISGQGTLYTSFGFPVLTTITGISYSGYNEIFATENSGIKTLQANYEITTGSFARNYSNLDVPPNLYFRYWQTDSSSFSTTLSPNGQFIYYNNISNFGAPLSTSGYVGDYHYIIYNANSGWQIRRKSSNSYGWSGLKTQDFPISGWTGVNLSSSRGPGEIQKIGFSDLGIRSIDPAYQNRNYFSIASNVYNLNNSLTITGSGNCTLEKTLYYTGILKSGVAILPILGIITGIGVSYVTGFNRNLLELKSGVLLNPVSLRSELQYNKSGLIGSGLFQTNIGKTGYYESSGILQSTGYIFSQVEFPYSGAIDTYSGYLNNSITRSLSNLSFVINNSSGYIQTGIYLKQDKSIAQDSSGRIKNLLPLNLYPITDYSGQQDYILYATGFFKEQITGLANVSSVLSRSGKFFTSGLLNGYFDVDYIDQDFGSKYISQQITGVLINPTILDSNIILTGSSIGTGFYDNYVSATGSLSRNISVSPKINIPIGSTITGLGLINLILSKNMNFNVNSGKAYYQNNPYLENINGNLFTGYIDPFIATGNISKIANKLLTGYVDSSYTKTFLNSFNISTGYLSSSGSSSDLISINSINSKKYSITKNIESDISQVIININKINHYNDDYLYAKLILSGKDSNNNPSVIYQDITGGSF